VQGGRDPDRRRGRNRGLHGHLRADLEYAPEEIPELLKPVLCGDAQVVYGTRSFGSNTAFSFWYVLGNKAVTMFANAMFNT
jgi:dolichol-phosphate hexosyltransferase